MILVPPELWENLSQTPKPVKQILKSKSHRYKKWTQFRLYQDPYLKNGKHMREHIHIPIIKPSSTKPKQTPYSVQCLCLEQNSPSEYSPKRFGT